MIARPQYVSALVLAMAFYGTTGFADESTRVDSYYPPAESSTALTPDASTPATEPANEPVNAGTDADAMQPAIAPESIPATEVAPAPAPRLQSTAASENLNVYGQRRTEDEFITEDVMRALQSDSRIHGKIGVDTFRKVVTLTGRVTTPGQVDRISYVARGAVAKDVEIRNDVRSMLES